MNHNIFYDGESVLVFGDNGHGQLGLGDNEDRNKAELLMTDPEIKQIICGSIIPLSRNNGDVLVFGDNDCGQLGLGDNQNRNKPELLMTDPEIKQIICGGRHTMIWRNNGDVLVFGYNAMDN